MGLFDFLPFFTNKFLILPIFNLLDSYIASYGLIILILTVLVKLALSPFTYKSYLSMAKMKVLKPEIDALKEKHKDDQQKFASQQWQLFQKAGVNPLGGCLPMLLQLPFLIAMYRLFPAAIELRQESFLWATDLSTYDAIVTWDATIPFISSFFGNHISLFTVLMAIVSFFSAVTNQQMTAGAGASGPLAQQMKIMPYIMPVFLMFIFNKFPAALTYYYFLFNLFTVAQQVIIKKYLINEEAILAEIQEKKKRPVKKSKWATRLEEMQKQQKQKMKQRKR